MKKIGHPWYWPSPRYYAYVEPNRPGAKVMRHRNNNYCVEEVASCSSRTRAEKIAAALNRAEKRRKIAAAMKRCVTTRTKKGFGHA